MRRLTYSIVTALLALLLVALPVAAGTEWCEKDPIVTLNGTRVQILVAIPNEYLALVNGPVDVEIATPQGTAREVIFLDEGFNGHGERVRFTNRGHDDAASKSFPTRIEVRVPTSNNKDIPVRVTVIPDNANQVVVTGANRKVTVDLTIAGR